MRFYVASSFLNKVKAKALMVWLELFGHVVTFDWTKHETAEDIETLMNEAEDDLIGVQSCERMVVLWPGRLGTASEIGAALALGKKVMIIGMPHEARLTNVYFNHPLVQHVTDEEFIQFIVSLPTSRRYTYAGAL